MLIINRASAAGVAYWQRSAVHSAWLGLGAADLGLCGPVQAEALKDVLYGRRPGGGPLTARPALRRRHGWDFVLSAPKSVSLLALSGAPGADALRTAFREAVAGSLAEVEERAAWVRRAGTEVRATGVVAASFEHARSDAGQPHLHAHVVLANLGRPPADAGGDWGCLVASELWRWREAAGPLFHLSLRHHLASAGFGFDWVVGEGGMAEIAAVPGAARTAASARSLASRAGARRFGSWSARAARTAQVATRGLGQGTVPELGTPEAGAILASAMRTGTTAQAGQPAPPPSRGAIEGTLAERASTFGEADVFAALAESLPVGLSREASTAFVTLWCQQSPEVPGQVSLGKRPSLSRRRWANPAADALDRQVLESTRASRAGRFAQVSPAVAQAELEALGMDGPAAEAGARLACSGDGVSVLPRGPWLAQAACADAARAVLQAGGMTVRVASPTELSAARWRALTSLPPMGPGLVEAAMSGWGRPGRRALVIDAADRLSPADLSRALTGAASAGTKVVLVPGGAWPALPAPLARALEQLSQEQAALSASVPEPAGASRNRPARAAVEVPGLLVRGATSGREAMADLVAHWQAALGGPQGLGAIVALGADEAGALNAAARAYWLEHAANEIAAGRQPSRAEVDLTPRQATLEVALGERAYALGDLVLALHRIGPVRSSTVGTVVGVGGGAVPSVTVTWGATRDRREPAAAPGPTTTLSPREARSLGYAYATTVPYLRAFPPQRGGAGLWALGDPHLFGAHAPGVRGAWVTVAGPGRLALGPSGELARRRAGVRELATTWPDQEMLERAGPRPLNVAARAQWAEVITRCAFERGTRVRGRANAAPLAIQPGPEAGERPRPRAVRGPWMEL
ncbi:MAG TPA: MobF family relaxase [Acidimicrobiales bacterium]|nr:MobF family relaxase [Acidimicrobiales bacterium]